MSQVHPMLEKVARAMLDSLEENGCYAQCADGDLSKTLVDGGLFDIREVARAAVRALMEPDEDLLADGAVEADTTLREMRDGFRAMLLPLLEGEGE